MIVDLTVLLSILGLIIGINELGLGSFQNQGDHAALAFGFILLAAYLLGRIVKKIKLPMITGYLLAGIFFGPHILGAISPSFRILPAEVLSDLSIFNSIALGLIAFSAGGEMKMEALKERWKSIVSIITWQVIVVFAVMVVSVLLVGGYIPFLHDLSFKGLFGVSLIFAVTAIAKSPASTIALIFEYRSKGPMTTTVIGVTIVKDVVVIAMFSIIMLVSKQMLTTHAQADYRLLLLILWEVFGSILIGLALGWMLRLYMKYVSTMMPLILIALSFVALELSHEFHLSGLMMCIAAGFYIENFTNKGEQLMIAVERYSLPVFVLFFTVTGANLKIPLLIKVWPFVVVLVCVRLLSTYAGTYIGSRLAKDPPVVSRYSWLGFITQAGVTLGLAGIIGREIPGVGVEIQTILIAGVALNQLIGPVAFRYALLESKEATVID